MKRTIRFIISITLTFILCFFSCLPCFAVENPTPSDLQKNAVYITGEATYKATNYGVSFSVEWSGTGFAVGKPGEPVQYIATCDHVVAQISGVYYVYLDGTRVVDYVLKEEGTTYPFYKEEDPETGYTLLCDYFKPTTDNLYAVFSESSGDKVQLSVVERNEGSDIAVCKIASDPVDKISAFPLKINNDVNVGDDVYVIGYPFISDYANSEKKYDYSDSTIYSGIVSKKSLSYGLRDSNVQYNTYMIDASMTNGNSGGPIFAKDGSIIGIASFGTINAYKAISANYAVCIDELIPLLDKLSISYETYNNTAAVTENTLENTADNETNDNSNPAAKTSDTNKVIAIAAAAVIIAAIVSIVVIASKNKKKSQFADESEKEIVIEATPSNNKQFYLIGLTGIFAGKKFSIDERIVIGRDKSRCNIVYPESHPGISGVHCEISKVGATLTIKDCSSTYGTFLIDGTKLTANVPVVIKNGDKFMVADKENIFEIKY
ncbi:MAG: trypsin-like peptidase domain-containing protein [Eubacterium sp.]